MEPLWCVRPGVVPYESARRAQKRLEHARLAGDVPDLLILLEHPPVYTKGRRAEPAELAMGEDWYRMQGIEVADSDRGGKVTYHGPGQLVGYPIVSLKPYGDSVRDYVRRMERVMIDSLAELRIEAEVIDGLTGVWVGGGPPSGRKIGSIGIHVSRGVTTHGFAINVNNDLQPFEWIVPCGIEGVQMTSVCRELGREQDISAVMNVIRDRFGDVYQRKPVEVSSEQLMRGRESAQPDSPASGEPASVR